MHTATGRYPAANAENVIDARHTTSPDGMGSAQVAAWPDTHVTARRSRARPGLLHRGRTSFGMLKRMRRIRCVYPVRSPRSA
jgi:hypothetical protein